MIFVLGQILRLFSNYVQLLRNFHILRITSMFFSFPLHFIKTPLLYLF